MSLSRMRSFCFALIGLQAGLGAAQPVEVQQGSEIGAGFAFRRGDSCLVLTALHVVPSDAADIAVLDRTGARNAAQRAYGNPSYDLALLEITGKPAVACTERWPDSAWLGSLNPNSRSAFEAVRHYPSGGRETLIALRYAGRTTNTFTLAPVDRTTIRESDSGTIVRIDDKLAGIVQSVDPKTDRVEVLRMDVIDKLVGERFRGSSRAPLAVEGVRNRGQINANWTAYLRSWVAESTGRNAVPAQDPSAKCRLAVDLMDIRPTQVPNPAYEQSANQDCSLMTKLNKKLGAACEDNKRKTVATVPRQLTAYMISADVKVQPTKGGPALAKVASGTVPIDAKRATRSIDEQFSALEVVMAPAAKELIAQAGCD
jgi:hypothetical protein